MPPTHPCTCPLLPAGCLFSYNVGKVRHETRVFDESMIMQLIDSGSGGGGAIRQHQPIYRDAVAAAPGASALSIASGGGGRSDAVVAVAQRDVTLKAASLSVQVTGQECYCPDILD